MMTKGGGEKDDYYKLQQKTIFLKLKYPAGVSNST